MAVSDDAPGGIQALTFGGQPLWLLPEGAAWHAPSRSLFVADLHLGKAAAFRARGLPVPSGTSRETVDRLAALVRAHHAAQVVLLGDLLHSTHACRPGVLDPLRHWRVAHPALRCVLVRGNHDRHAGDPPPELAFEVVDEPWPVDGAPGLAASHHPREASGVAVLAGHWHPMLTLAGPARDQLRLPCFCRIGQLLVLPAFGAFTGGSPVPPPAGSTCWAVGGGRVWPALAA